MPLSSAFSLARDSFVTPLHTFVAENHFESGERSLGSKSRKDNLLITDLFSGPSASVKFIGELEELRLPLKSSRTRNLGNEHTIRRRSMKEQT